jgi:hypothetical protein
MKASYRFVFIREQKFTWQIFAVLKAKFSVDPDRKNQVGFGSKNLCVGLQKFHETKSV